MISLEEALQLKQRTPTDVDKDIENGFQRWLHTELPADIKAAAQQTWCTMKDYRPEGMNPREHWTQREEYVKRLNDIIGPHGHEARFMQASRDMPYSGVTVKFFYRT